MKKLIPHLLLLAAMLPRPTVHADGTILAVYQKPASLAVIRDAAGAAGMRVTVANLPVDLRTM